MKLLVLPGDGIGPEITRATLGVLEAADSRFKLGLSFEPRDIGFAPNEAAFPPVHIAFEIFDPQSVDLRVAGDARNWYLTMGDSDAY